MASHNVHGNYDQSIIGLFRDRASAECCVSALKQFGLSANDIKVAQTGAERAVGGASNMKSQGFWDDILSLFGAGNDLNQSLLDMGFPNDAARRYCDSVDAGNILLAAKCIDNCDQLQSLYNRCGAYDVTTNAAFGRAGYGYRDTGYSQAGRIESGYDEGTRRMPIREERLVPHKEERQAGGVEVTKDVKEEQRSMRVPLSHEEVTVEHRQVNPRPSDRGPEKETMRIPLSEEDVSVSKESITTGEVEIGKRPVTEHREIKDTIRKEEPRVEKKGDVREGDFRDEEERESY